MTPLLLPLLLAALVALGALESVGAEDFTPNEITSMPGWTGDLPFKMHSGYLKGGETERLFYIYVEAEDVDPSEAPVTAWFNGGPGCSSFDGFWTENGPFEIQDDLSLELRPYRWNRLSNMLWMEAPVGVGLSYDTSGNYNNSDDRTANMNQNALNHFFEVHPSLKSHDFYLTGESYAGIYIPTMSEAILDAQAAGTWVGPPLKGIAVGNGCTGTEIGICGFYEGNACDGLYFEYKFLAGFGFFDDHLKEEINRECNFTQCITNVTAISSDGQAAGRNFSLPNTCVDLLEEAFKLSGHLNVYNVMGVCDTNDYCQTDYKPLEAASATQAQAHATMRGSQSALAASSSSYAAKSQHSTGSRVSGRASGTGSSSDRFKRILRTARGLSETEEASDDAYFNTTADSGPAECLGSREPSAYMNRREVIIDTFKARNNGFCWGVCNRTPKWHYNATRPNLPRDLYPRLIGNMRVLIYNGDVDACVPYTDNEHWTENMGYTATQKWHPWSYEAIEAGQGTQVAGYRVEYDVSNVRNDAGEKGKGSFEFKTIRGAGHMVPDTRPAPALEMFRRFIGDDKRTLGPSYGAPEEEDICLGVVDRGTEVALMVLLVFFMISLVITVCLYLRVRELQQRQKSGGSSGGGSSYDDENAMDYDTKLDISDRSERSVGNPLAGDDDDDLTTVELNNLRAEYLND